MTDLELDVRPLLHRGGDPFAAIMDAVEQLAKGQCLRLYATFKPEPLLAVMARQGFASEATPMDNGQGIVCKTNMVSGTGDSFRAVVSSPYRLRGEALGVLRPV